MAPALAGACGRAYLNVRGLNGTLPGGTFRADRPVIMALPLSTPEAFEPTNRLGRAIVLGGAGLAAVLLFAAAVLWLHYGTAVFFEMIASGFAACF